MTAEIDTSHEFYLYAQNLDNTGGTEYWRVTSGGATCELLLPSDARLPEVRSRLDDLQQVGRSWSIGGVLPCRVNFHGDCVITIQPTTLDVDGRVSPVLLLFNALAPERQKATAIMEHIPNLMKRGLTDEDLAAIVGLNNALGWPRWILLIHLFLFSRSVAND
jgi:hypothetical protein